MKRKSFTLVEVLVSITIFIIVISTVLDLSVFALKIQQRNLADQYLLNQVNYTMEYISRQLRMAQRDDSGNWIAAGCSYEKITSGIKFINHNGEGEKIFLDDGQIKRGIKDLSTGVETILPVTSDDFEVTYFNVSLAGECDSDTTQPRATIAFGIKKKNSSQTFQFQTTISQRNLDL